MFTGWISSICRCHRQTSVMKSSSQNIASVRGRSTHSLLSHTPFLPHNRLELTSQPAMIHGVITLCTSGFELHPRMFAHSSFIVSEVTTRRRLISGWTVCDDQMLITKQRLKVFSAFDCWFDWWINWWVVSKSSKRIPLYMDNTSGIST